MMYLVYNSIEWFVNKYPDEQLLMGNYSELVEKILWSLEELSPQVKVPEEIRLKAKLAVERMLKIGRTD